MLLRSTFRISANPFGRFGWINFIGLPKKTRPSLMNCLRNSLRNSCTFKKTGTTFKKTLSTSSGMSIIGLQASIFFHSGNMSNSFVKSRANGRKQRNQVGVEHRKTIEAENNQKTPLCDVSDTAYEDSWPSLSASMSQSAKNKPRSKIHRDPNLVPRQNELPEQVEPFFDMDSASQKDGSFDSTPCSELNSTKHSPFPFGTPHKGRVDGYGRSRQKARIDLRTSFEQTPNEQPLMDSFHDDEGPFKPNSDRQHKDQSFRRNGEQSRRSSPGSKQPCRTSPEPRMGAKDSGDSKPFEICIRGRWNRAAINPSLPFDNDLEIIEFDHFVEGKNAKILMPGMVILKRYIPLSLQVNIALRCREIGLGKGGFYQPGYEDGAKLRLHMMCLGLDWDPQTRRYSKKWNYDNTEPPNIPHDFSLLVQKALRDSHSVIKQQSRSDDVEEILPIMNPDICIVNFYSTTGRLGLHQDHDESRKSISRGLPVVSFSIGDSAEFLYGEKRDVDKAEKVLLESGDVLIFGGDSRLIFHGVASVLSKTAPKELVEQAKLRPGRLNLTFRKY